MPRRLTPLLGFCAALSAPAIALAQTDTVAQAEAAYRRGVESLRAHHPEDAIESLTTSYRLAPTPTALYNLGLAHNELHHDLATLDFMERYLHDAGADVDPRRAAALGQLLAEIRRRLTMVELRVTPDDVTVVVDDRAAHVREGVLWVEPGAHTLRVEAPRYVTAQRTIEARAGERVEWRVTLDRVPEPAPPNTVAPPANVPQPVVVPSPETVPHPVTLARPALTPHPSTAPVETSQPFYTRWWFWTAVGVVVAGAATAAVVAATAQPEGWYPGTAFQVETITLRR